MTQPTDELCSEMRLLIQADVDGELEVSEAAKVAAHLASCQQCAELHGRLRKLKQEVRTRASYYHPSAAFEAALMEKLQVASSSEKRSVRVSRKIQWWMTFLSFGAGAAIAAMLVVTLSRPTMAPADELIANHIRALQPGHLIDVESMDTHTVKPWFEGKLDFAPTVKNLAGQGYALEGGRLDYFDDHAVAALVYRHGKHPINMFMWPSSARTSLAVQESDRRGYHVYRWIQYGMEIWVVADVNAADMRDFIQRWQSAS